jgi:hypothetical protein
MMPKVRPATGMMIATWIGTAIDFSNFGRFAPYVAFSLLSNCLHMDWKHS